MWPITSKSAARRGAGVVELRTDTGPLVGDGIAIAELGRQRPRSTARVDEDPQRAGGDVRAPSALHIGDALGPSRSDPCARGLEPDPLTESGKTVDVERDPTDDPIAVSTEAGVAYVVEGDVLQVTGECREADRPVPGHVTEPDSGLGGEGTNAHPRVASAASASTSAHAGGTSSSSGAVRQCGPRPRTRGGSSSCTPPRRGRLTGFVGWRPRRSAGMASTSST